MAIINCFAPIAAPDAKILILGSMPGQVSLTKQEYYGHPHNLFWQIMSELFGASPHLPYATRLQILIQNGIAIWDVLHECEREGSLDSDIEEISIIANDFSHFFLLHPHIHSVFFNGTKAEAAFKRYILPTLKNTSHIRFTKLPSTSPANASISKEKKLSAWKSVQSKE